MEKPVGVDIRRKRFYWAVAIVACVMFLGLGWRIGQMTAVVTAPVPLRLSGYQYISPLISCNLSSVKVFAQDQPVANAIQAAISQDKSAGNITDASVYFSDFTTSQWTTVNGAEKYYPSSLGKVPIMMAYYAMAESSSSILDDTNSYPARASDQNAQQEIPPAQSIVPGKEYTNKQLIEYMIKYSDNNAAEALTTYAPAEEFKGVESVYSDLDVPVVQNATATSSDIMTPQQYSILFRTLYNATYLSRDDSEDALALLTQTAFTQGIVAGVPSSTVVAHKYGLASYLSGGVPYQWELHDCGIVYAPGHSYLLCVMTKGAASVAAQEKAIADISSAVYNAVED
jgi:beta-lactamase class A